MANRFGIAPIPGRADIRRMATEARAEVLVGKRSLPLPEVPSLHWTERAVVCRIRWALGMAGHVLLSDGVVQSDTSGYWLHDRCKRNGCNVQRKLKVQVRDATVQ